MAKREAKTTLAEGKPTDHADPENSSLPGRAGHVRQKVLRDHVESVIRRLPPNTTLPQSLTLEDLLSSLALECEGERQAPGGLTTGDVQSLAPVRPPVLSDRFSRELEKELQDTLVSIADYWDAGESPETDEDEKLEAALQLPERIRAKQKAIEVHETSLQECRARVVRLVERINEAQPALEAKLVTALSTLPPELHAPRLAEADVVAATIETALLKLSLVRARAHRALYGYALPNRPDATVSRAVAAAYEKLRERQRAQEAETQKLDRQIEQYESMLRLVDGRDGSFGQVVKDMARVKRETEECRKDLRRLGWTGD
ncbi:hypothetical protein K466DRAFT_593827 [Polyporus arcularius HHB13444]|uniref:Uncharacterized protein n=1 Tax=Polyporus arcularius HHB13444 TaxID=1314778 RepID=A0A5C3Q1T9_9APHY|nr:hypothetical protein K466DRAFT_593827 [Polyporus arcularius HHB13444]